VKVFPDLDAAELNAPPLLHVGQLYVELPTVLGNVLDRDGLLLDLTELFPEHVGQ